MFIFPNQTPGLASHTGAPDIPASLRSPPRASDNSHIPRALPASGICLTVLSKLSVQGLNALRGILGGRWSTQLVGFGSDLWGLGEAGQALAAEVTPCPLSAGSMTALAPISTPTEPLAGQGDSACDLLSAQVDVHFLLWLQSSDQPPSRYPSQRHHGLSGLSLVLASTRGWSELCPHFTGEETPVKEPDQGHGVSWL